MKVAIFEEIAGTTTVPFKLQAMSRPSEMFLSKTSTTRLLMSTPVLPSGVWP